MPSNLARIRPRVPGSRAKLADGLRSDVHDEPIRGPWPGYIPDIEPSLVPYSAMRPGSFGLVSRGEVLVPDVGWSRLQTAAGPSLPLGDDGAGSGTIGAGTSRPQAIQHLGMFNRQPTTDNEIVAITQNAGGASEATNVFHLPSTVVWATVPPRNGYAAPTYTPWSLAADQFVDDAVLATGFNVTTTGYYAGAAGRGVVGQPIYFFVNENNLVACWPCYRAGVKTEYDYPIEAIGTLSNFSAATCAALEGRMCYGNVTYGGVTYPQRMWHSAIGDGAAVGTGIIGAGFVDAPEMAGQLLRLLRLGDALVGYYETGIVVYTRTYNPLSPFNPPQYLTTQVSALSKRSVCAIDRDRHMILAEQGWYLLDNSGLTELGLLTVQGGGSLRKWQDTFYAGTNLQAKEQISIVFDGTHHLVEVSFPSTDSDVADTSWLYDTLSDRVVPAAPYAAQAIQSHLVAPSVVTSALSWGGASGTWGSFGGAWSAYSARKGFHVRHHGDRNGYVYVRDESRGFDRESTTGAAIPPGYAFVSPQRPVVAPSEWADAHRFEVEYVNVEGPDSDLTVNVDDRMATGVRSLQDVAVGKTGVAFLPVAGLGGTHHGIAVTGTAPVAIRGMQYSVIPDKGMRKGNA